MYGLPNDFDPQIFVGRRLETVTFAVNVIVLAFGDQLTVTILGSLPYFPAGDVEIRVDRPPVSSTSLVSVVGRNVVAFDLKSPRELILEFEGRASITLLDDSDSYESYLIKTGKREIVV
ncbi:MAG TPA: hypothetical protein VK256_04125 [Candidatus Eisenbacteria bacterium]|nr:hypothetical protein [Candidatus Eisenbacteria bacterium]